MKWRITSALFALGVLALAAFPAYASGPFDGKWTTSTPTISGGGGGTSGGPATTSGCQGFNLAFTVADSKVNTKLKRASYGNYVETSAKGAPFTGTIAPDGTFVGTWQKFKITGKFSGNNVELHWKSQCGPRTATGTRAAG